MFCIAYPGSWYSFLVRDPISVIVYFQKSPPLLPPVRKGQGHGRCTDGLRSPLRQKGSGSSTHWHRRREREGEGEGLSVMQPCRPALLPLAGRRQRHAGAHWGLFRKLALTQREGGREGGGSCRTAELEIGRKAPSSCG